MPRLCKPLDPYLAVANRVARWADRRDAYSPGHAERVTSFCAMIADGLDLGAGETAALLRAAMLHDIGKVALPVEVLHQKTPLLEEQVRWIRTHPKQGAALVRKLHCASCHEKDFRGREQMPRLAAQREEYLESSMNAYRNYTRTGEGKNYLGARCISPCQVLDITR